MSSLLQFRGNVTRKGVELPFYLIHEEPVEMDGYDWIRQVDSEPVACAKCGKEHPRLYLATRKPAGMFGPWVVFRYNGDEHAPSLSHPIAVDRIPRGARALSDEENAEYWHK